MRIKKNPFLLIFGVGFIFFGLNQFFELLNFEHQKNNAVILMALSSISFVSLVILKNKRKI